MGEAGDKEDTSVQTFALKAALEAIAKQPVSLGFVNGKECFTSLNPDEGFLTYTVGLPPPPPPPEPEKKQKKSKHHDPIPEPVVLEEKPPEGPPLDVIPEGWLVRDIDEQTCE